MKTQTTTNPMHLRSIDEHPRMEQARRGVENADAQLRRAQNELRAAQLDLMAAEDAAIDGARDDKRLRLLRSAVAEAESNLRLAERGVTRAAEALMETREAVRRDVGSALKHAHGQLAHNLDALLEQARVLTLQMAALEDHASQLFPGTDQQDHRPPTLAWRREFAIGGRLDLWRECGLSQVSE